MPTLHRAEGWRHLAPALILSLTLYACGEDQPADLTDTGPDADVSDVGEDSGDANPDAAEVEPDPYAQLPAQPWPVHERGHYGIGYSLQTMTYLPRGDDEVDREIQISIWYPTLDSEGRRARYLNALNAPGVLQDPGVAIRDDEPAPLMLFSHGNGSFGVQSYFFAEYLASHGYVVIGPDHKGNTFADTGGSVQLGSTLYRPQDMSAVLDWIEQLPQDHALAGKTSSKIAISGHSLGDFTTLASTGATLDLDAVHTGYENDTIS